MQCKLILISKKKKECSLILISCYNSACMSTRYQPCTQLFYNQGMDQTASKLHHGGELDSESAHTYQLMHRSEYSMEIIALRSIKLQVEKLQYEKSSALFSSIGTTVLYFLTTVLYFPNQGKQSTVIEKQSTVVYMQYSTMAFRVTVFPLICMASMLQSYIIIVLQSSSMIVIVAHEGSMASAPIDRRTSASGRQIMKFSADSVFQS